MLKIFLNNVCCKSWLLNTNHFGKIEYLSKKLCSTQNDQKYKWVLTSSMESVFTIGLNRQHIRNAITPEMAIEIGDAIKEFEESSFPVAVLYGVGGTFSAGSDMNTIEKSLDNTDRLLHSEGTVGPTRRITKKPIVCAVSGYCVASGLELALMCDLRVMEEDALMGFFNRRFGVPIVDGGTSRLPAMIGLSRSLDLILTGRQVDAKEALQIGLANRLVACGTSLGQSINLAGSFAKFPQAGMNHDRNAVYSQFIQPNDFNSLLRNEIQTVNDNVRTEMASGLQQFKEGVGRSGRTKNIKPKTMADWEQDEIEREVISKSDLDKN